MLSSIRQHCQWFLDGETRIFVNNRFREGAGGGSLVADSVRSWWSHDYMTGCAMIFRMTGLLSWCWWLYKMYESKQSSLIKSWIVSENACWIMGLTAPNLKTGFLWKSVQIKTLERYSTKITSQEAGRQYLINHWSSIECNTTPVEQKHHRLRCHVFTHACEANLWMKMKERKVFSNAHTPTKMGGAHCAKQFCATKNVKTTVSTQHPSQDLYI